MQQSPMVELESTFNNKKESMKSWFEMRNIDEADNVWSQQENLQVKNKISKIFNSQKTFKPQKNFNSRKFFSLKKFLTLTNF